MNGPNITDLLQRISKRDAGLLLGVCVVLAGGVYALSKSDSASPIISALRQNMAGIGTSPTPTEAGENGEAVGQPADTPQQQRAAPDDADVFKPTFDIVRVEPTGDAVIAGLSKPNDEIQIVSGVEILAEAKANSAGEWALVLSRPLPPGGHSIAIRSVSDELSKPVVSVQQVTIAVPQAPTESAIVLLDRPGQPSALWQSPAKTLRSTPVDDQADGLSGEDIAAAIVAPEAEVTRPPADVSVLPESKEALAVPDKAVDTARTDPVQEDLAESGDVEPTSTPQVVEDSATVEVEPAAKTSQPDATIATPPASLEPLVTVEAIETEGEEDLFVAGASIPKAIVRVYFDEKLVGETSTNTTGRWQLETKHLMPAGTYSVRVDQVDHGTGSVLARRMVPFERIAAIDGRALVSTQQGAPLNVAINREPASGSATTSIAGTLPDAQVVVVGRGDNLWSVSRRVYGRGIRYTTIYNANEAQIKDPAQIFPGQVLLIPDVGTVGN